MKDQTTEAWKGLLLRKSQIKEVPLSSVYVDPRFQRDLNPNAVNRIKEEYHPQGIGQLLLARIVEDGTTRTEWAVIDGQTRFKALEELHQEIQEGRREVEDFSRTVLAEVFDDLTPAEAALLFSLRNAQRPVPPAERDRIAITEGDPTMREVMRQSEAAGYTVFPEDEEDPTAMPAIEVAKRVVRWGDKYNRPGLLTESLNVQANAFGRGVGFLDRQVLGATADLIRKNPNLDDAGELARVMAVLTLPGLRGQAEAKGARQGKRMHGSLQLVMIEAYNKGKRRDERISYQPSKR